MEDCAWYEPTGHLIEGDGIGEGIYADVNARPGKAGLMMYGGPVMDVIIIAASSATLQADKNRKECRVSLQKEILEMMGLGKISRFTGFRREKLWLVTGRPFIITRSGAGAVSAWAIIRPQTPMSTLNLPGFNGTVINPPAEPGRLTNAGGGEQGAKIENPAV